MDIMLSALQHYAFCPRQCALIHLEQVWQENSHTIKGQLMHETAHSGRCRLRNEVKVATDLELHSSRLGLHGRADVVEFHRNGMLWHPYPVEYKKGRPHKGSNADEIQLCAQALCLEEMLGEDIPEGALFYGESRRRLTVSLNKELRKRTEEVVQAVRDMFTHGITPLPRELPWCSSCSLNNSCLPEIFDEKASSYVRKLCEESP